MKNKKEQAAGFSLAIAMITRRQHRDFAYIPFASGIGQTMTFHRGKIPVTDILRIATRFMSGGTNFKGPLKASLDGFRNADIIFVTDGDAYVSEEFMS